ncbi:MAG: hypothetical protein LBD11_02340 [Candidatus Peribacteria bacterium]|jgi:hypothetical protein|nr:hypothetical protein [Candidatus Peribacteria bacterium]
MTTLEFQGHSFSIENDAKRFLEKYLKRIDSYAQKHHIDTDVVDDIYQSILEKLFEIKKPISQKKLITIVNAL